MAGTFPTDKKDAATSRVLSVFPGVSGEAGIGDQSNMIFSGTAPDDSLVEIIELKNHPWFLGCQFHPEFKSRPMNAHPLFREFIGAAKKFAKV